MDGIKAPLSTDLQDMVFPKIHLGGTNEGGLTKRELFAAMAMSGWFAGCANAYNEFTGNDRPPVQMAKACVQAADALLAALQEVKP